MSKAVKAAVLMGVGGLVFGQVTITGPVRTPTGQIWDGELRIQSQMMFCNGVTYPPTTQRVKVVNGQLNISIQPTDVCGTGYSYKVYYVRYGKTEHVTYWMVPSTPTTNTVQNVQVSVVPTPQLLVSLSQLGNPGPAGSVVMSNGYSWSVGYALIDPTTNRGDLIVRGGAGSLTRLGVGASGQVLTSDGFEPYWTNPTVAWGYITGTLNSQTDLWAVLGSKANTSHTHAAGDIVSGTMDAARLGGGTPTSSTFLRGDSIWAGVDWASVVGKPSTFPPSSHTHPLSEFTQSGATVGQVVKWNGMAWAPADDAAVWGNITGTLSNQTDLQSVLDSKASTIHTHAAGDITSGTIATARLGSGTASAGNFLRGNQTWSAVGWADVAGKPSTFPPSSHTHPTSEITQSGAAANQALVWSGTAWSPSNVANSVFGRTGAVTAQTGDYNASQITNTPAGNVASTTVQGAINELDSEKAATSHTHAASAITSGTIATARLGSGTASNTTFLRGDQTWNTVGWNDVSSKPNTFPPSSHTHPLTELSQSGATAGQIPKWNGTAWVPAADDVGSSAVWGSITGTLSSQTDLQAALDSKANTSHTHAAGDITSGTIATARLGSGTPSSSTFLRGDQTWNAVGWADVSGKPSTFPPSSHTHTVSDLTQSGATANQALVWSGTAWNPANVANSVFGRTGAVTAQTGDYTASQITNTPSGNVAATTVQAAINELDSEKAATIHTHSGADITSGVIAPQRLGTGTPSNTNFLRGDGVWAEVPEGGGTANYSQSFTAQTTVTLTHNAGTANVIVSCYDSGDVEILPQSVSVVSVNEVNVVFSEATTGRCVVNSSGGGGGAAMWGSITGVLSDQSDLQAALDGKAPTTHTHAASDITSGVFAPQRLGIGTPDSTKFLRGDGTWAEVGAGAPNYSQSFTTQTSVSLTHNAGTTNVIVSCYDSSNVEVVPQSVTVTSANVVDVTFSEATTGRCVVNSSGGGGGGSAATWGSITGTLSDQTDLQAALDSKASTTHTHSGADITSGTIAPARLGSGTPSSSTFLRGDGTWAAVSGGSVYTGAGLTGDGSQADPVRVDPNGGVASQAAYQATIDFGSIGAGSCAEQNVTAVGVAAGSTIAPGWPATLPMGLVGMMYAGSDVIVIRLCNVTLVAVDPPSATYTARVIGGF